MRGERQQDQHGDGTTDRVEQGTPSRGFPGGERRPIFHGPQHHGQYTAHNDARRENGDPGPCVPGEVGADDSQRKRGEKNRQAEEGRVPDLQTIGGGSARRQSDPPASSSCFARLGQCFKTLVCSAGPASFR